MELTGDETEVVLKLSAWGLFCCVLVGDVIRSSVVVRSGDDRSCGPGGGDGGVELSGGVLGVG